MKPLTPKPPPSPARFAYRRAAVALRRAIRCGPPTIALKLPGWVPGIYTVESMNGTRHSLDIGGVHGGAMLSRWPGPTSELRTHFDAPNPPVPVFIWMAKPLRSGVFFTSARTYLKTSIVVGIRARPEFCVDCSGVLLLGRCWRRAAMGGHWWRFDAHYRGKKYSRKYRIFMHVSNWLFGHGL